MTIQQKHFNRIPEIDILRGIVMIIMALDHVRTFFGSTGFDPLNIELSTPLLFLTRWITHFCAPVFVFLAGTSAYLYGKNLNKTNKQLAFFLFTRGLWIIFIEIFIWNLIIQWLPYQFLFLQVLWAIGWSMCILALLVYLPHKVILTIGLMIVIGHNAFDGIKAENLGFFEPFWAFLHQKHWIVIGDLPVCFWYPILPWIGVIAVGFAFGAIFNQSDNQQRTWLFSIGILAVVLFVVLRAINGYGDPFAWQYFDDGIFKTVFSFINTEKYPPSLLFILMTLGPSIFCLPFLKTLPKRIANGLVVFGSVPMFYYLLHFFFIQIGFVIWAKINFGNSHNWFLGELTDFPSNYEPSLLLVYGIWISIILLLYPICKWYMKYKKSHKQYWWLSYL